MSSWKTIAANIKQTIIKHQHQHQHQHQHLPGQTDDPASSTNPLQLANTARFLSKLDAAIVQQEAVVAQTTDELQQVEKQWQQLYLNDKSLGRFIEERERAIEKDAIKRDDRASQSNWLSSTLSQSE